MNDIRLRGLVACALVLVAAACGGAGAGPRPVRPSRAHLTPEDFLEASFTDAYSVVETLRPAWLREYPTSILGEPERAQVYIDGMRLGGPELLRGIATNSIGHIEFLNGLEASQRFGLDHGAGAILVSTLAR